MTVKSDLKETSIYVTIASSITGVLMALGYLTPDQAGVFLDAIVAVIGGVITIGSTVFFLYSKMVLKREEVRLQPVVVPQAPASGIVSTMPQDAAPTEPVQMFVR